MVRIRLPEEPPEVNFVRLDRDLSNPTDPRFTEFWKGAYKGYLPDGLFENRSFIGLEIGAGSGQFITSMATHYPERFFIAIERSRHRGSRLVRKTEKSGLKNLASFRGNIVPAFLHIIPETRVDRIYILYPPPWYKTAQRKNRWFLHPIMPKLYSCLKPGGLIIWASDQHFYIEEAKYVCEKHYQMHTVNFGRLSPNKFNELEQFPKGRSKFEEHFLQSDSPCFELIVRKTN